MSRRRTVPGWVLIIVAAFGLAPATAATAADKGRGGEAFDPGAVSVPALRAAIEDLARTFPDRYTRGQEFLQRLAKLAARNAGRGELAALRREALLAANPLLDFDKLLVVRRSPTKLGLPQNWQGNCALPRDGYDNEVAVLSGLRGPAPKLATLLKPDKGRFVGDLDLHPDGDRFLISMPGGKHNRWHVWEARLDGSAPPRQLTPDEKDVDCYDACFLPDGGILFGSTACLHGVPCVGGSNTVANLYRLEPDGKTIRQLTFDQDHDWCPAVLNDGRVSYTRWEYSDTPHYFSRILFRMNPDGTGQGELYGSNSYWPNGIFYARPVPGHPTKVVGIVSGHHGVPRMGELVIFDPARSQRDAGGAVQRIPSLGKSVDPIVRDTLVDGSWPKFLHPFPLSDKHVLVACQPGPGANWGLYLADTFDNLVLIAEEPGQALLEPVPLRKTAAPPVVPSRVDLASKEATVYIADVYAGEGMKGVPRGVVKRLRVYEPHYAYPGMGGHIHVGVDGPWDVRRIWGTVPVAEDGSCSFIAPANTPLALQPLDAEGKAVQVMRSWLVAMPGEKVTCVGCHERPTDTPPLATPSTAFARPPSRIEPWRGPVRGFSFKREVQPVLDRHCVGCHDGGAGEGKAAPDLSAKEKNGWRNFTPSYLALHPYVRRPGPESDYHLQKPYEWHADTSELVQMLEAGHHGVKLDAEAWDRLITWIDLNVPDHGTWGEHAPVRKDLRARRIELRTRYANNPTDPEAIPAAAPAAAPAVAAAVPAASVSAPRPAGTAATTDMRADGWPFDAAEAKRRQQAAGLPLTLKLDLPNGESIAFLLVPAGSFVMGDGLSAPARVARVDGPFYIATTEITNAQYAAFDPLHDSRYISVTNKDQNTPGEAANRPKQPVIRVSQQRAIAFCDWLARRSGERVALPTETQWEFACRAGAATAMSFGDAVADFAKHANLADARVLRLCRADSPKWIPAVATVDDRATVTEHVGRYLPNAFGLFDVHGNVAEWTAGTGEDGKAIARGGSFYDRPHRATASSRRSYHPWQPVFDVGFRPVILIGI